MYIYITKINTAWFMEEKNCKLVSQLQKIISFPKVHILTNPKCLNMPFYNKLTNSKAMVNLAVFMKFLKIVTKFSLYPNIYHRFVWYQHKTSYLTMPGVYWALWGPICIYLPNYCMWCTEISEEWNSPCFTAKMKPIDSNGWKKFCVSKKCCRP